MVSKCSTATCAPATCTAGMRKLCMESSISGLSGAPTPFGVAFSSCAGRRLRVEAIATHMSLGSAWAKSSGAHGIRIRSSLCHAPIGSGRWRARTGRVVVSFFCNSPAGMCACAVQGTTLSVASHASTRNRCCCTFNLGKRLFFSVPSLTVSLSPCDTLCQTEQRKHAPKHEKVQCTQQCRELHSRTLSPGTHTQTPVTRAGPEKEDISARKDNEEQNQA